MKVLYLTILSLFFSVIQLCASPIIWKVTEVSCEYTLNPVGIESKTPRLSWKIASAGRDVYQTAYQILVLTDSKKGSKEVVWDSGKVLSDQSVYVSYNGKNLESNRRYYWQVRIWDNKKNRSPWSSPSFFETGFLDKSLWQAKWISTEQDRNRGEKTSPMFRKAFELKKNVKSARLYITAQGLYEAHINGKRVGDHYLTPGWTSYHKRLQYQVYDITQMLNKGINSIGVALGEGWFAGRLMGAGDHFYGNKLALLAQMEITFADGTVERVISDGTWKVWKQGPIVTSEIYNGEVYDARKELSEWTSSNFDDRPWESVKVNANTNYDNLVSTVSPLVEKHEIIKVKEIITTPKGEKVIDFGQNLVGWVKFKVRGKAGDSIYISHAEVLDNQGNFYTENLRSAKQRIGYHLKGAAEEIYEPRFTFQGFRFIKIDGNKELINKDNIEAIVLHSAMKPTGKFRTSNPLINQLQHNIQWGQKGNFVDVPTDCPQRDEREGWTGDAQVFFNTAAFNMDVSGFFAKWLLDLKADQQADGAVPQVIPNVWGPGERNAGSAGWADASTIVPWNFYLAYGDKQVLAGQYESMKAWAAYIAGRSTNHLWNKSWHHGDWLYYMPKNVWDPDPAFTDKTLIAQAFYACTVQNIIDAAKVLGFSEDVATYSSLLEKVKAAFQTEFVTKSGTLVSNTQTAYTLALQFDLLPEEFRKPAAERLVNNIRSYGNHISTGFLGTPYLCHVLTKYGYNDVAYDLLMQESYPSWLYPVKKGATTIWERWDGLRPDGTFQSHEMNSFNHYAYGAIGDWMYKNITGISQKDGSSGYKQIQIAPKPGGGLTWANAELETIYGKVVSNWKVSGNEMTMRVEIPVNTRATVIFPRFNAASLKESGKVMQVKQGVSEVELGSGVYDFEYSLEK